MEYGSIDREIHIDAPPEVVFEVISSPEHIREWWGADSDFAAAPGETSEFVWGDETTPRAHVVPFAVVEADPPRRFSFRWMPPDSPLTAPESSPLLVTFELVASGDGTVLRLSESGFREVGWEVAVMEAHYQDHVVGWERHLSDLRSYAATMVASP